MTPRPFSMPTNKASNIIQEVSIMVMKVCSKCKRELMVDSFYKDKSRKDGLQSYCKKCVKQYGQNNVEKGKQYRIDNQDRTNKYYQDNKVVIAERHKLYKTRPQRNPC